MSKKVFLTFIVMTLLLSACGALGTEPTLTPQPEPTETNFPPTETLAPTATATLSETLTPTPTPTSIPLEPTLTPLPPENAADCVNAGRFISDVTIPDNSDVAINQVFTKTWRVQNVGTCIWWAGYTLAHYSELDFGAQDAIPLAQTSPGETVDLSVDLLAPDVAGAYRGNFVIWNPDGLPIEIEGDSRLWVIFNAVDDGGVQPAPTTEASSATSEPPQAACEYTPDVARIQILLTEINTYRAESNLPAYTLNDQLAQAAQTHATDMACNRFFVHTGSDGSTPETRTAAAGYTGSISENVYGSYPPLTAEEVKDWWRLDKTDPNHNLNLTSNQYTEVGIGYAFYDNFGFYTVVFGTP